MKQTKGILKTQRTGSIRAVVAVFVSTIGVDQVGCAFYKARHDNKQSRGRYFTKLN